MKKEIFLLIALLIILLPIISAELTCETEPLFSGGTQVYINDNLNKVKSVLTKSELPNVLSDEVFHGNVNSQISQMIIIGSYPKVTYKKQPTSYDEPNFGLELSTTTSNYIYRSSIIFSQAINFSDPNSEGKTLNLFGKEFIVSHETDQTKIVLINGEEKITLISGVEVMVGEYANILDGTRTEIIGGVGQCIGINIYISAKDSDNDAIKQGESFKDPVFGTFNLDFAGINIPESSTGRENIQINPNGNNKMNVVFKDHRGIENTIPFLKNKTNYLGLIHDDFDNKIHVIEMANITYRDYVVIGNEYQGYLLELYYVKNQTTGYSNDEIIFKDVFSGDEYETIFITEGGGVLNVGGKSYWVEFSGSSTGSSESYEVRLDYPDSANSDELIIYPTIQTSKGAKLFFYEPMHFNLDNWDGTRRNLNKLKIPDGEGYTDINLAGITNNTMSITYFNMGPLIYQIYANGRDDVKISLLDISEMIIDAPALVIFEEKDDNYEYQALIVKFEYGAYSYDGLGINDVERTWGADSTSWESTYPGFSFITKEADLWGTIITTDATDSDQKASLISYPDNQVYPFLYISENCSELIMPCMPNIVNTSLSNWENVSFLENNKINQSRFLVQYDGNFCGEIENKTFYENRTLYIPHVVNSSWSAWENISCLDNDKMNQSRFLVQYDENSGWIIENITFYEYQSKVYCGALANNPTLSIFSPNKPLYKSMRVLLNLSSTHELSRLEYIDNPDISDRELYLCRDCSSYTREKPFRDGEHELLFLGTLENGTIIKNSFEFLVDSREPRLSTSYPRTNRYTNGSDFSIKYTEDNCVNLDLLINGEIVRSMPCDSGRYIEKSFSQDLTGYNGETVYYMFNMTDIAGNYDESRLTRIKVDTEAPEINDLSVNRLGRYVSFSMNISNEDRYSFDRIEYYDNYREDWRILCSSIRDNICSRRTYLRGDISEVQIRAKDEAGNVAEAMVYL